MTTLPMHRSRLTSGLLEEEEAGLMPGLGNDEDAPLLDKKMKPRFRVLHHITIRADPYILGDHTGDVLKKGTIFEGHDIVTSDTTGGSKKLVHWVRLPLSDICYISLGEGNGWAISHNPMTEEALLERCEDDFDGIAGVQQCMSQMFLARSYDRFINVVIIINAVAIYTEIDHRDSIPPRILDIVNLFFSAIYVSEVVLKLFAFGVQRYFEANWNIADFCITLLTLLADVVPLLTGPRYEWLAGVASIAPVARLLRLLRLAKAFKELATLLESFFRSVLGLLWIAMLMLLWFFMCACITTTFLGSRAWMPDGSIPQAKFLRDRFNTVPHSIFTLLEVMTLEGWPDIVRPLMDHSPALMMFFICFIFITSFVLLNLVTAVVVDKMLAAQQDGQTLQTAVENDQWAMVLNDLRQKLKKLSQGEARVKRSRLEAWMAEGKIKAHLDILDWNKDLVLAACNIVDKDMTGYVDIDEVTSVMSGTQRPLVALTLLRMQADLVERMVKQDQILSDMFVGKQKEELQ